MIKCFMITPSGEAAVSLRRWNREDTPCPATGWSYHNAHTPIGRCRNWKQTRGEAQRGWFYANDAPKDVPDDDPRWPVACACGYVFTEDDVRQVFTDRIYLGPDGAEHSIRAPSPGAMWFAEWLEDLEGGGAWWKGPDGRILICQTPGGQWMIDSRASNCTMPTDNEHRCWVRHGTPPELTVDKNGKTCAAGAGSILCGSYHGFLQNGYLT